MINKYTNKQRGLLAVIMAMVMVFAGAAYIAGEADAEGTPTSITGSEFLNLAEDGIVVLDKDYKLTTKVEIVAGTTLKVDLNGYNITVEYDDSTGKSLYAFTNYGNFILDDSSESKDGTITARGIENKDNGVMVIEYARIVADDENGGAAIWNEAVLTVKDGSFEATHVGSTEDQYGPGCLNNGSNAVTVINGGEFISESARTYAIISTGNLTIEPKNGNDVVVSGNHGALAINGGVASIAGGVYGATVHYALYATNACQVDVSGGNFVEGTYGSWFNASRDDGTAVDVDLKITGGSFSGSMSVSNNNGGVKAVGGIYDSTTVLDYLTEGSSITLELDNQSTVDIPVGTVNLKGERGNITINGSGKAVISEGTFGAITNNATLEIAKDCTANINSIDNKSELILNDDANVTGNTGEVVAAPGVDVSDITGNLTYADSFGMSQDLESDYTVKTSAFLANDLTIPEGVTLTIDGTLNLNGKKLFVEGTLAVGKKGTITDIGDGSIVLSKTGTIVNEGIIGKDSTVTVADKKTDGNVVSMKNVIGLSFGLTKEIGTDGPVYTLTVSGEAAKKGDAPTLAITGAYVSDFVVKDVEVTVTDIIILKDSIISIGTKGKIVIDDGNNLDTFGMVIKDGSELIIDGAVTGSPICMYNGSVATINGSAQDVDFTARTGEYPTYTDGKRNNLDTAATISGGTGANAWSGTTSSITLGNLNGITIEITSKSFTKEVDEEDVPYIEQMMNVYGTAAFADKDKDLNGFANADEASAAGATLGIVPSGDITVVGNIYIPAGSELILGEDMDLITYDNSTASYNGTITTVGLLKTLEDDKNNYKGSKYVIEATTETGSPYEVFYYTNFDDAYAAIATADDMTIYIAGGYEFTKEYTIAAEQEIVFVSAGSEGFKISKDGKVTVETDGTIGVDTVNFATKGIKGILIVMDDATCIPAPGSYEVSSKDADNNMTYTSAELAIANAQAGETIYITDNVTFEDKTTIPEGVTVEIANSAIVTAEDDLIVDGKLVNEGTVKVEATGDEKVDLIVKGEIDNTAGVITVDGDATITGTFEGVLAASNINAAKYYDGENDVYTSIASAVADCAEMDVIADVNVTGKVSESSDIVLAEGQKLIIDGEVVLKSVRLDVGSNLTVNGKLTADVIAATGVMDTTGALADSVISVKEIEDVEFDVKKNDAKSTVTMYMDVTTPGMMNGTTTVTAGSVQLDAELTVSKTNVMKVSEGATLVVMENITAGSGNSKYFSNAGTLIINKAGVILNGVNLGGTIAVADDVNVSLTNATVSGALTTGEDASVTVTDVMYIGSKPTTLGAAGTVNADVAFGNNAYIVVFEGSTFTNTDADVKMDSTAYTINDIAFATVYILENATVDIETPLDAIVLKLEDLQTTEIVNGATQNITIEWKSGSSKAETVGQYDTVNAKIVYASVDVTISVGPGMLVYIDDIKVGTEKSLTIGTHTITVYIEKGYEGTPAITLNGVAVTDGKLVITTDMMDLEQNLLSVTGATVMQDQPVVIQPSDSEKDGMDLTDILLIVLVVLIVIMAIIVALRMMRS